MRGFPQCQHEAAVAHLTQARLADELDVWQWMPKVFDLGDPCVRILSAAVALPSIAYLEGRGVGTEWLEPALLDSLPGRARASLDEWLHRGSPIERPVFAAELSRLSSLSLFWVQEYGGTSQECSCVIGSLWAAFQVLDEGNLPRDTLQGDIRELALLTSDALRLALGVTRNCRGC